jgi:hypothetical protein
MKTVESAANASQVAGFSDWSDILGLDLTLCMVLEYSSGAAQQEADNYDADERTRRERSDKPSVQLQHHDEDKPSHGRESTAAKNEKRENAGSRS